MDFKVLEICPYEPPASGWVKRIKLLRNVIESREGFCEILDIGPSRKLQRPECIPVMSGLDYLVKVNNFAKHGFVFHCHINGEYFRGILLAIAAFLIGCFHRNRRVITFHAGVDQPYLHGWKRFAVWPFLSLVFFLANATVCNSNSVKKRISVFQRPEKILPIPAFTKQYMDYKNVRLSDALDRFIENKNPVITTYLCFRDGFFIDVILKAASILAVEWPESGLVIVGTGDEEVWFAHKLHELGIDASVILAGNLGHDAFLSLMSRSDIVLRTPVTDGVSSTVLEALALNKPVVASENNDRPESVVTYQATDPRMLVNKLRWVMSNRDNIIKSIPDGMVADTASQEVDLLEG